MKNARTPADCIMAFDARKRAVPIWTIAKSSEADDLARLPEPARAWLTATGFSTGVAKVALVPGEGGALAGVVLGLGGADDAMRNILAPGALPQAIPAGVYRFESEPASIEQAAVAWALGCYRFDRYKSGARSEARVLMLPKSADRDAIVTIAEGVWLGRDLINTPASDLGPADLADAAVSLARKHGAKSKVISGDDLLGAGFPMVHAVGRASSRPPCLADLSWAPKGVSRDAPRVTLVGKGICFDTGGLDIKPASAMLMMKKDMGGAATALALAHMIMKAGLDVRLRVLIAAAENAISGNAFRPGDVLDSRKGITVEIGNTDAEGRLVLGDALALGDEDKPDLMVSFATLTGAARVALGPELPAMFSTDDGWAQRISEVGLAACDPCWRLPFWPGYERMLDSDVADINHVSDGPFAGAVTAALFLRRFVRSAKAYVHFDMYAWTSPARPAQPKGGETQMARALFDLLRQRFPAV